eukprot:CAMPEP_0180464324 /NCGR_PEP_ID=MMETSP1036_2-20121128/25387_1 /TAXON_ID=632150 /ORGANISM="Azadinium spinosum, Strain 3D9" /LENGTH=124 /DNA_ID=CAMNT_0022471175 /DNA_START=85 /DNA_END=456 /DNA_ORIENTATION=+
MRDMGSSAEQELNRLRVMKRQALEREDYAAAQSLKEQIAVMSAGTEVGNAAPKLSAASPSVPATPRQVAPKMCSVQGWTSPAPEITASPVYTRLKTPSPRAARSPQLATSPVRTVTSPQRVATS